MIRLSSALLLVVFVCMACSDLPFVPTEESKKKDASPQVTTAQGKTANNDDQYVIQEKSKQTIDPALAAVLSNDKIKDCECVKGQPSCDCRSKEDTTPPNICDQVDQQEVCTTIPSPAELAKTDGLAGDSSADASADPASFPPGSYAPQVNNPSDGKKASPAAMVDYVFNITAEMPTIDEEYLVGPVAVLFDARQDPDARAGSAVKSDATTDAAAAADSSSDTGAADSSSDKGSAGSATSGGLHAGKGKPGYLGEIPLVIDCNLVSGMKLISIPGDVVQVVIAVRFIDKDNNIAFEARKIITLGTARRITLDYIITEFTDYTAQ